MYLRLGWKNPGSLQQKQKKPHYHSLIISCLLFREKKRGRVGGGQTWPLLCLYPVPYILDVSQNCSQFRVWGMRVGGHPSPWSDRQYMITANWDS